MADVKLVVYGTEGDENTRRTREHLKQLSVPYDFVDIDKDQKAADNVKRWNHGKRKTPVVQFTVGEEVYRIAAPDNAALDQELQVNGLVPNKTGAA